MVIDIDSTYCRYGPMVLRRCQRLLADPQKAEDAMQAGRTNKPVISETGLQGQGLE